MNPILTPLLQVAGFMHAGLLCAGLLMPRTVRLRQHLATLPPFICRLYWVYYTFIGTCLVSFGLFTVIFAGTLAAGGAMAQVLCGFFAIFWTIRLVAAVFVFDVRPYLTNGYWRIGYHATNIVFVYLPVVYGWAALKGGK